MYICYSAIRQGI